MTADHPSRATIIETVRPVLSQGTESAAQAMEALIGRQVGIELGRMEPVPYESLYDGQFRADSPLVMIIVRVQEGGFMVLMMYEQSAQALNAMLWGELNCTDGVISLNEISALKELGNIVCTSFLNALADATESTLRPGEPIFVYDMLAAVMQTLLIEQGMIDTSQILLIETFLTCEVEHVTMEFLFLPSPELTHVIVDKLQHG